MPDYKTNFLNIESWLRCGTTSIKIVRLSTPSEPNLVFLRAEGLTTWDSYEVRV